MGLQTFSIQVTKEQLDTLVSKAKNLGLDSESGTLPEQQGVQLSYLINFPNITFTVLKKPFIVPVSLIKEKIQTLINTK